ncbi:hypothetical protein AB0J83_27580 [Actinoplanes sp. NPDC049596]|uniref:hypothetical protein n=1 Tax=unclassified Actinoplanes TaxID=2626549 RepID=UPI003446DE97
MADDTGASEAAGLSPTAFAILANAAAVLGLAGGLVYSLVALGYDRFYEALGISPGDVGVDQRQIISHTTIALAIFLFLLAGVFAVAQAALSWFFQETSAMVTMSVSVAVVAGIGPILLGVTMAPVLFARPFVKTTVIVTATVLATAILTVVLHRFAGSPARRRALVLLWVAAATFVYSQGIQFATNRMAGLADRVIDGHPIPPAGLTFVFDVHADPVCIRAGKAVFYALYLGENDGWVAFYRPSESRTVRRSREGLELSFIPATGPPGPRCT